MESGDVGGGDVVHGVPLDADERGPAAPGERAEGAGQPDAVGDVGGRVVEERFDGRLEAVVEPAAVRRRADRALRSSRSGIRRRRGSGRSGRGRRPPRRARRPIRRPRPPGSRCPSVAPGRTPRSAGRTGRSFERSTSTARGAKKYRSFCASTRKVNPSPETAMSLKPTSARAVAIRSSSGARDTSTVSRYGGSWIGTSGRPMSKATEAETPSSFPRCQLASISSHSSGLTRAPTLNGERTAVGKYFFCAGSVVWRS